MRSRLAATLGVRQAQNVGKYLGIPSIIGRSKKEVFQMLVDRTRKKTKDWKRRFLSMAGKVTLIKSIVQAIPTYIMSCFRIPEQICQQLNGLAASFLWGQKHEERKIHWCCWKKLCRKKEEGGLGFRNISLFNQAMLAKQAWRILINDDTLLARSLKARYFPRTDLLQASVGHNPSFIWRSLLHGMNILKGGIAWRVGNGKSIKACKDRWIPDGKGKFWTARGRMSEEDLGVDELMCEGEEEWDRELLYATEGEATTKQILSIPIRAREKDQPFWPFTSGGLFTVRSGYHFAKEEIERNEASSSMSHHKGSWKKIWSLQAIPKIKLFLWKCMNGALPTKINLARRSIPTDPICSRCGRAEETVEHALRDCEWAKFFWRASPLRLDTTTEDDQNPIPISTWFESILQVDSNRYHSIFASLIWVIWYARNLMLFQEKTLSHADCFEIAMNSIYQKINAPNRNQIAWRLSTVREVGQWKGCCDAALLEDEGMGIGMVIMNDTDQVVIHCQKFLQVKSEAIMGEALAMKELTRLVEEFNPESIILESDCQTLINKLRNPSVDLTYWGRILKEIREQASKCRDITFSWIPREDNSIAHELAKNACRSRRDCTFAHGLPMYQTVP